MSPIPPRSINLSPEDLDLELFGEILSDQETPSEPTSLKRKAEDQEPADGGREAKLRKLASASLEPMNLKRKADQKTAGGDSKGKRRKIAPITLALPPFAARCTGVYAGENSGLGRMQPQTPTTASVAKSASKPITSATSGREDPHSKNPDYFPSPDLTGPQDESAKFINSQLQGYRPTAVNSIPPSAIMTPSTEDWKNDKKRKREPEIPVAPSHYAPYQASDDIKLRRYDTKNKDKEVPFNSEIIHANANGNFDRFDKKQLHAWLKIHGQPTSGKKDDLEIRIDQFLTTHGAELDGKYGTAASLKNNDTDTKAGAKDAPLKTTASDQAQSPADILEVKSIQATTVADCVRDYMAQHSQPAPASAAPSLPAVTASPDSPFQRTVAQPSARPQAATRNTRNYASAVTLEFSDIEEAMEKNDLWSCRASALNQFTRSQLKIRTATSKDKKQDSIDHITKWYNSTKGTTGSTYVARGQPEARTPQPTTPQKQTPTQRTTSPQIRSQGMLQAEAEHGIQRQSPGVAHQYPPVQPQDRAKSQIHSQNLSQDGAQHGNHRQPPTVPHHLSPAHLQARGYPVFPQALNAGVYGTNIPYQGMSPSANTRAASMQHAVIQPAGRFMHTNANSPVVQGSAGTSYFTGMPMTPSHGYQAPNMSHASFTYSQHAAQLAQGAGQYQATGFQHTAPYSYQHGGGNHGEGNQAPYTSHTTFTAPQQAAQMAQGAGVDQAMQFHDTPRHGYQHSEGTRYVNEQEHAGYRPKSPVPDGGSSREDAINID